MDCWYQNKNPCFKMLPVYYCPSLSHIFRSICICLLWQLTDADAVHSLISPHKCGFFCSIVASKNKLRQSDSVNNKGMQRQFCFVSDESKIIYISTMVKKRKKSTSRDVFELCYNIIQYQYVLRLQKLCYYSECVSDHSYSNVL